MRQDFPRQLTEKEIQDLEFLLVKGAKGLGLDLTKTQQKQFLTYLNDLKRWNQVHRLTAITEDQDIIIKHFLDSLSLVLIFPVWNQLAVLDVGSGAGLPGIPLKIVFPHLSLFLLEGSEKKSSFLHHIVGLLGLEKVEIINKRFEAILSDKAYRGFFDRIVSRGVGKGSQLVNKAENLLKKGGAVILYGGEGTGTKKDKEIGIRKELVLIPCSSQQRTFWIISPPN
ncbi:MAG TPA: 16S rRNA (guanine(527)-N(7))-methyltransferase RsmG [Nitrospiria bacterium]|jgi:16S rRNA (guanine527-N7)-methyltransferase